MDNNGIYELKGMSATATINVNNGTAIAKGQGCVLTIRHNAGVAIAKGMDSTIIYGSGNIPEVKGMDARVIHNPSLALPFGPNGNIVTPTLPFPGQPWSPQPHSHQQPQPPKPPTGFENIKICSIKMRLPQGVECNDLTCGQKQDTSKEFSRVMCLGSDCTKHIAVHYYHWKCLEKLAKNSFPNCPRSDCGNKLEVVLRIVK